MCGVCCFKVLLTCCLFVVGLFAVRGLLYAVIDGCCALLVA